MVVELNCWLSAHALILLCCVIADKLVGLWGPPDFYRLIHERMSWWGV